MSRASHRRDRRQKLTEKYFGPRSPDKLPPKHRPNRITFLNNEGKSHY